VTTTVYVYAGCSTCKKALAWLDARGVRYRAIPIVEAPPTATELAKHARAAGVSPRKLINLSGNSYRALIAERGKDAVAALDDAALLALLAADGKMIKRPLLVDGKRVLIGFDEAAYAAAFKA
jgi:arsenate reductase